MYLHVTMINLHLNGDLSIDKFIMYFVFIASEITRYSAFKLYTILLFNCTLCRYKHVMDFSLCSEKNRTDQLHMIRSSFLLKRELER